MGIEAGVVVDLRGQPLHWHQPPGRSGGFLPDSRTLWDVFAAQHANILGFAHTHPWYGQAGPSTTDTTTFEAIELGLGRRFRWWVVTFSEVVLCTWDESRRDYLVVPDNEKHVWIDELRRISRSPKPNEDRKEEGA